MAQASSAAGAAAGGGHGLTTISATVSASLLSSSPANGAGPECTNNLNIIT